MTVSVLPVNPRPSVDPRSRALRATLASPGIRLLREATALPPVVAGKAMLQRGNPIASLDQLARIHEGPARAEDEALARQAAKIRVDAYAAMRSDNDLNLRMIALAPESKRTVFRSASINIGQLDIAGLIKVAYTTERRELYRTVLADILHGNQGHIDARHGIIAQGGPPDVIECQEVWLRAARTALRKAAEENGYMAVLPDSEMKRYGLQLLVRKRPDFKRVVEHGIIEFEDKAGWSLRAMFDRVWGSKRGLAYAIIELTNGDTLLVTTTHLSPLPEYAPLRAQQFRAMTELHNALAKRTTYAFHGSDLNTPDSTGGTSQNTLADTAQGVLDLHAFLAATGLRDTWAAVTSKDKGGTLNQDFSQFEGGDYDMRGKRIDYQLAASAKEHRWVGALDYRTTLGGLYDVGDGTKRAFSDHLMVEATYVLA